MNLTCTVVLPVQGQSSAFNLFSYYKYGLFYVDHHMASGPIGPPEEEDI
jgi:hypothetical protein